MYNEQIENLINAALADGVLTEKEKQILFKKAESMGIDLDEFEMVLDARLVELKKKEAREAEQHELEMEKVKAAQKSAPKSNKFGDIRKCPACGAILQSFQTRCPECGYEFKNVEAVNSAKNLFDQLQAVELRKADRLTAHDKEKNDRLEQLSKRHNSDGTMAKLFGGKSRKETQDEEREDLIRELNKEKAEIESQAQAEKANVIKMFPIPNSKEDLLELLAMATSSAYDNDGVIGKEEEVWIQKTDQIYQKIIVCAANDKPMLEQATNMIVSLIKRLPDRYKKFTTIPDSMKGTLKESLDAAKRERNEQIKGILLKCGIPAAVLLILGIIFFLIGFKNHSFMMLLVGIVFFAVSWFFVKKGKRDYKELNMFN